MKKLLLTVLIITMMPLMNTLWAQVNGANDYDLVKQRFESYATLTAGEPLWFHLFPVQLPDLFAGNQGTDNMETLRLLSAARETGTLSEIFGEEWFEGAWLNSYDMFYYYDDNNYLVQTINKIWEEGAWIDEAKTMITNNSSGMPVEAMLYIWNTETSAWDLMAKMTYTYNGEGDVTQMLMEFWMDPVWMGYMKINYFYNEIGVSEIITQGYDFMLGTWVNTNRDLYTYNSSGYPVEELSQIWDSSQWMDNEKESLIYDGQWQHVESIILLYNGSAWDNYLHYTYQYNTGGDITVEIEQSWSGEAWVDSYKYLYTYLRSASVSEILELYWNGDAWENSYRESYYYNPVGIAEKDNDMNEMAEVYPNPFHDNLQVNINLSEAAMITLAVYDLTGKIIETIVSNQHFAAGDQNITWKPNRALDPAIYILKLTSGTNTYFSTIIKR